MRLYHMLQEALSHDSMTSLPILLAPLALLLPFGWYADSTSAPDGDTVPVMQQVRDADARIADAPVSKGAADWSHILHGIVPPVANQVRIQRRVIIRISPARSAPRNTLTATQPSERPVRIVERDAGNCIESARIGAIADRGDKLLLFMRDRRTIAARLEKGCSPRDFYKGAYMESSQDGRMCVSRDRLMSRAGAKCQVAKFTELVVAPSS